MVDEEVTTEREGRQRRKPVGGGPPGAVYGLGFIGAVVYFIQNATSFWIGVFGVLKAIVWPALVVFKLLEFLKL